MHSIYRQYNGFNLHLYSNVYVLLPQELSKGTEHIVQFCRKLFSLNPQRPVIRNVGHIYLCILGCISVRLETPADLTRYALDNDVLLCRYDIAPENYTSYYLDNFTVKNELSCPDLPRYAE